MPRSKTGDGPIQISPIAWGVLVCSWLAFMMLSGGISTPSATVATVQTLSAAALTVGAVWRLRHGFPTWVSAAGALLAFLGLMLIVAQLVPLPPEIWQSLPHRDLIATSYDVIGQPKPWLPLNMQPLQGMGSAMAFVPAVAAYMAALTLDLRNIGWVAVTILCCALIGALLALSQKYAGVGGGLYLYGNALAGTAVGTFSNRNFLAAQTVAAIPFVAALAVYATDRWRVRPWLAGLFAVVYMGILLAGLAVVGSRAGVLLAMLAVFFSFVFVFKWHRVAHSGVAALAALAAFFAISQASMVGILRLVENDPLEDLRPSIMSVSLKAAQAFFPAGSGFGSFASAYQIFERPADIVDNYANHAHNDWLELVMTGGLPAVILLLAFVVLVAIAVSRLIRFGMFSQSSAIKRAAAIAVLLLMVHAIVDFGLRTPALLTFFAMSLGLVTLAGASLHGHEPQHRPVTPQAPPGRDAPPRQFVPGTFGNRRKPVPADGGQP